MRVLGEIGLLMALIGSAYAAFACLISEIPRWAPLRRTGIGAAGASLFALTVTLGSLAWALLAKDFRLEYVAHYTSDSLPWHFSLSALWVGQAGSLLLWTWMQAVLSVVFVMVTPATSRLRIPSLGLLMGNVCFLTTIMVFAADPMKRSLATRADGLGLSPLLQHPSMLIHPPIVFLAYAAWSVPCALACSALLTGEVDARWTRIARPWSLFAWTILGAGLLLGAHWAYQELGWGGYWGWDPVENGSLLPWLTGTASVHSLLVWRHRGSMKKMALALAMLTFGLCNFATFLTRSGIFSSVHAFSQSPLGWMFLGFMVVLFVGGVALICWRRHELQPEYPLGSLVARESLILGSAYLLLLLTGVVFVGTLWVPLSKLVIGRMVQVGPAFYGNVLMPTGLLVLAATAVMPLVRWGDAPRERDRTGLLVCGVVGGVGVGAALWSGARHPAALAVVGLTVLMVCATISRTWSDFGRRRGERLLRDTWWAIQHHRRRYASYVIHLALASVAVGITGSSLGTRRGEFELSEGEVVEWGGRRIEYVQLIQREKADTLIAEAELRVTQGSSPPAILLPARQYHQLQKEWTTEVDIHSTWGGDFYTILHAGLGDGRVVMTFVDNPLMRWIWLGGWLAVGGAMVAAWPNRRRATAKGVQIGDIRHLPGSANWPQRSAA